MNVISNILYWISTGLLVPVIVLLDLFLYTVNNPHRRILLTVYDRKEKLQQCWMRKSRISILQTSMTFFAPFSDRKGILVIDYLE